MNFKITVTPDDGMYKRGVFVFDFKVPKTYPHDPPKVQCETTVFHPNIDMEGHVCLNILREDWKPVLTIQSVIMGLQALRPPAPRPRHLGLCTSAPLRPSGPLHLCTSPRCSSASQTLCPAARRRTSTHLDAPGRTWTHLGAPPHLRTSAPRPSAVPDARAQRRRPSQQGGARRRPCLGPRGWWRCAVSSRAGARVGSSQAVWAGGRREQTGRRPACARSLTHSPRPLLATGQAAAMLSDNPRRFADTVKQTFQGRTMQAPPPAPHRLTPRWRRYPTTLLAYTAMWLRQFESVAPAASPFESSVPCRLTPPHTAFAAALSAPCLGSRVWRACWAC